MNTKGIQLQKKSTPITIVPTPITNPPSSTPTPSGLSYTLPNTGGKSSAGIYINDGTDDILVRTLWSNKDIIPGTYSLDNIWDGKDDLGNNLPSNASYKIKILTNNITADWGVIGNTSLTALGTSWNGYDNFYDMCIYNGVGYVAQGYGEAAPSKRKFNISNPQVKVADILGSGQGTAQFTYFVCTDGTKVYWGENVPFSNANWFVHATKVADDTSYLFSSGTAYDASTSIHYPSIIDYNGTSNAITGLAVANGFIFVSHASTNTVNIYNSSTGAFVSAFSVTNPRTSVGDGTNLWLCTGTNIVSKYSVSSSGVLTLVSSLAGITNPFALAVNSTQIVVVDGGTQQIRFFNKSTGVAGTVFGQAGGYNTSSVVFDNKFMFQEGRCYIAFQTDGSYWVGDYGNARNQHFSSSNVYIDNIALTEKTYSAAMDRNNPTRCYSELLEFSRDYTKPLLGTNGSWKLTNNWRYGLSSDLTDDQSSDNSHYMDFTTTINGHTYTWLFNKTTSNRQCFELVPNGLARYTGKSFSTDYLMDSSGNMIRQTYDAGPTIPTKWYQQTFLGLDGSNNPTWGAEFLMDSSPIPTNSDPAYRNEGAGTYKPSITSTGIKVNYNGRGNVPQSWYDNGTIPLYFKEVIAGYHLGGVKNGKYLFKTCIATHPLYFGPFPSDGAFDIGNSVSSFAGASPNAIDRLIFQSYHGEFWKGGQVNMHNLFYDNGLMLAQFGNYKDAYNFGAVGMAGNNFTIEVAKYGGDYYLVHCDESYNAGLHQWKIGNVASINEQVITIPYPINYVAPALGYTDLSVGLPYRAPLVSNNTWTVSPANYNPITSWGATTGVLDYKPPYSLYVYSNGVSGTVTRTLGSNTGLTAWTLSFNFAYSGQPNNAGSSYIDVLDNAGKIITRVNYYTDYSTTTAIKVNTTAIKSTVRNSADENALGKRLNKLDLPKINISVSNGAYIFSYDGTTFSGGESAFEIGANYAAPTTLRIISTAGTYNHEIGLANMRFYVNQQVV